VRVKKVIEINLNHSIQKSVCFQADVLKEQKKGNKKGNNNVHVHKHDFIVILNRSKI